LLGFAGAPYLKRRIIIASIRDHGHASKLLLQHLTPGVIAAFIAAVLVLIATIVLGFRSVQSLYRTHESIAVAYRTRIALDQVLATLLNAETGERGYVITNNPSYLDPILAHAKPSTPTWRRCAG
jgi:hypothetical protein